MKVNFWETTFNHPWETVTQAAWRKYPNPMNPSVLGIDVLERNVNDGVLQTHRLLSTNFGLPAWVSALMGKDKNCYVSEYSEVDVNNKSMTLKSKNLTLCKYVTFDEKLVYSPHPTKKDCTVLQHRTAVSVFGMPCNGYLESLMARTVAVNANKGRQAIEWVISKLHEEVCELSTNAVKSMDEISSTMKKSMEETSFTAKLSMDEISLATKKSMDEISFATKKSMDEISLTTKKSMDDISRVAQKSMDNLQQNFSPNSQLPEL